MGIECAYSFIDLYKAAFGHKIALKEKKAFQRLSQEEINSLVKEWANKAGWKTREKRGTGNVLYLAFFP